MARPEAICQTCIRVFSTDIFQVEDYWHHDGRGFNVPHCLSIGELTLSAKICRSCELLRRFIPEDRPDEPVILNVNGFRERSQTEEGLDLKHIRAGFGRTRHAMRSFGARFDLVATLGT